MEELREITEGDEGDCSPIGRTITTNWIPQSSQRQNHQPKRVYMDPATSAAEDGLICHQWEGRPFVL